MGIPAEALLPFIFGNSGGGGGGGGASGDSAFIPSIGSLATISTGTSWSGDDPYTSTVTLTGYTVTGNTMVSVLPSSDVIEQMVEDGTTNIFISNNNGTLTANAIGAAPTAAMTLHVLCTESDASAELGNLPNIVGDGVLETLQATDLTDAINQLSSDLDDAKNAIDELDVLSAKSIKSSGFNVLTDCNSAEPNTIYYINVWTSSLSNAPFNDWKDGATWALTTYGIENNHKVQVLEALNSTVNTRRAMRTYYNSWRSWTIFDPIEIPDNMFKSSGFNVLTDCNSAEPNSIYYVNVSQSSLSNAPFNDWKDGATWAITTYGIANNHKVQIFEALNSTSDTRKAMRTYANGWREWNIFDGKAYHVGADQQYTRLRDGIAAAVSAKNSTVYVHPGNYNLIDEFAEEIANASGTVGISVGANVHVVFYDGAKVTALFDNSESTYDETTWNWIYDYFNPFRAVAGDFILENLDIEASNTRYCVHDEMASSGTYTHKYINCRMKYTNNHSNIKYVQCIGGGMGDHGTIVIDGGCYESDTDYGYTPLGGDPANSQQAISYHNGNGATCDGSIIVKNVYLKNRGYFRFGYHGSSSIKSQVQINSCELGLPILVNREVSGNTNPVNFELTEFCNALRNKSHWEISQGGHEATLIED